MRSASGPATQSPDPSRQQHQREEMAAVGLRVADGHLPERYEGDQPEPGHAPERDHSEEEHECARLVSTDGLPCASRLGGEAAEERNRQQERCRDGETGQRQQQAAGEAERQHERRRGGRPECVADVPADREDAHPARSALPARVGGELRALGVEGGHAQAGDDDEEEDEPVGGRRGGQSDPDPCNRDARRQQPQRPAAIRPGAEQRLDQRGRRRRSQHHRSRKGIRELEAVDHEGQERRQGAVREVGGEMACGESGHRSFVELGPHESSLPGAPRS